VARGRFPLERSRITFQISRLFSFRSFPDTEQESEGNLQEESNGTEQETSETTGDGHLAGGVSGGGGVGSAGSAATRLAWRRGTGTAGGGRGSARGAGARSRSGAGTSGRGTAAAAAGAGAGRRTSGASGRGGSGSSERSRGGRGTRLHNAELTSLSKDTLILGDVRIEVDLVVGASGDIQAVDGVVAIRGLNIAGDELAERGVHTHIDQVDVEAGGVGVDSVPADNILLGEVQGRVLGGGGDLESRDSGDEGQSRDGDLELHCDGG